MTSAHPPEERRGLRSPRGLVLLAFLAIVGFFLLTEHWAHVMGALPYVLLLLCPLLHLLLHGRHRANGHPTNHDSSAEGGT